MVKYSVVVPCFNEELTIREIYKRLKNVMDTLDDEYEIIFVNDGSRDDTEKIAKEICKNDKNVKLVSFSRNFGHQVAISAGMDLASGQAIVVIDADLQDPPEIIPEMIKLWKSGYDVVYGKRVKRKGETVFKKATAKIFYRLLKRLTSFDIPVDTGDFRLIDRKVCDILKSLKEKNRFIRGLVSWTGFKQCAVEYVREERFAGKTKYPLKKMVHFALDGITSFSYIPLKLATYMGFTFSFVSFLYLIWVIIQKFFGHAVRGWASTIATQLFFNGIILLILGIMGEYIGRIYDESKNRPLYIIKEKVGFDETNK